MSDRTDLPQFVNPDTGETIVFMTKADFAAAPVEELRPVFVPGLNGWVLVRSVGRDRFHAALRKATVRKSGGREDVDLELLEKHTLQMGLVQPSYTLPEVEQLMKRPMGDIQVIVDAINELSGMDAEERAKAANAFRDLTRVDA